MGQAGVMFIFANPAENGVFWPIATLALNKMNTISKILFFLMAAEPFFGRFHNDIFFLLKQFYPAQNPLFC
jgi:hypothetical protein